MNVKRVLGLAAVAGLLVVAAPAERAKALSLSTPGAAAAVQDESNKLTTEVRWHRHWRYHYHWRRHHWHRHFWRRHYWHRHDWHRHQWHRHHWYRW